MALGVTIVDRPLIKSAGQILRRYRVVEFTGDGSYSAGGYAVAASDVGLNRIITLLPMGTMGADGAAGTGLTMRWDSVNSKLKLYKGNGTNALQESGGADPSALKGTALVIGT